MTKYSIQGIEETRKCHCFVARKRARHVTRLFDQAFKSFGLRSTQFSVLAALVQTGPISISRLAKLLELERTTLTRIAKIMEQNKWISIFLDKKDERIRVVKIATNGESLLKKVFPVWRKVQLNITNNF